MGRTLEYQMTRLREREVAVLVDTATGWGRRLVRGILLFAKKQRTWRVHVEARGQREHLRLPPSWNGDGIIARVTTSAMVNELSSCNRVVNVSAIKPRGAVFPQVTNDVDQGIALAIEHFLDRGVRNFAYCSLEHRRYVAFHRLAFTNQLANLGFECLHFSPKTAQQKNTKSWPAQYSSLTRWLVSLPKPVGILTWAVRSGVEVINACNHGGVRIPEDVLVIGGDEDDLLCEACHPSLTGIEVPSEQIGHDAAELLDKLMCGQRAPKRPKLIAPIGVVSRLSTDSIAVNDPDLVSAIRYIREMEGMPLNAEEVANATGVSRRTLERRFMTILGRTIKAEIARVRLEKATLLLTTTEMSIPSVAFSSGFGSPEYFANCFKKAKGISPLKFRAQVKGR